LELLFYMMQSPSCILIILCLSCFLCIYLFNVPGCEPIPSRTCRLCFKSFSLHVDHAFALFANTWKDKICSKIKLSYKLLFCVNCEPILLITIVYISDWDDRYNFRCEHFFDSLRCTKDILTYIFTSLTYQRFNNQWSCLANFWISLVKSTIKVAMKSICII
jgi:hypothetical protein